MKSEALITRILNAYGYTATKIPESDEKTPDFDVRSDQDSKAYVIELKSRLDNPAEISEREQRLRDGNLVESIKDTGRINAISNRIGEAYEQLQKYDKSEYDFRIIWLLAVDQNQDLKLRQFESTLYGRVPIFSLDSGAQTCDCYYFQFNDFYRYRGGIDGAIISTDRKVKLLLNSYSDQYKDLRNSLLASKFGGGVLDPLALEQNGNAYIADCDIDRRKENYVIRYLCDKYGKNHMQAIPLYQHSVSKSSPITEKTEQND